MQARLATIADRFRAEIASGQKKRQLTPELAIAAIGAMRAKGICAGVSIHPTNAIVAFTFSDGSQHYFATSEMASDAVNQKSTVSSDACSTMVGKDR